MTVDLEEKKRKYRRGRFRNVKILFVSIDENYAIYFHKAFLLTFFVVQVAVLMPFLHLSFESINKETEQY